MPSNRPPFGWVSMWLPVTTGRACGSLPSRRSQRLAAASTETLAPISFAQPISSRRASRSSAVRQARLTPSPGMAPMRPIAISRSHCRCSLTAPAAWFIRALLPPTADDVRPSGRQSGRANRMPRCSLLVLSGRRRLRSDRCCSRHPMTSCRTRRLRQFSASRLPLPGTCLGTPMCIWLASAPSTWLTGYGRQGSW